LKWFTELASDEVVFEDAMHALTRYCLFESHHQTGSYSSMCAFITEHWMVRIVILM
jgi:hypothetical protein